MLIIVVFGMVGLGNIVGVVVVLSFGGFGVMFWMILVGLFSMSIKFVECIFGVKYCCINFDGCVDGGLMFYLIWGLVEIGKVGLGWVLGLFYVLCMIFVFLGVGNMF